MVAKRDMEAVTGKQMMQSMHTPTTFPPCPTCGSAGVVRIVYGYPAPETFEAADRGEIALGGCVIGEESPAYECRECQAPLPWVQVTDDD